MKPLSPVTRAVFIIDIVYRKQSLIVKSVKINCVVILLKLNKHFCKVSAQCN